MSDWKPIDTAPRDGTHVLVFIPLARRIEIAFCHGEMPKRSGFSGWATNEGDLTEEAAPTHWMPLPEPPPALPDQKQATS